MLAAGNNKNCIFIIDPMGNLSRDLLNLIAHPQFTTDAVRDHLVYIEPSREDVVLPFNPLTYTRLLGYRPSRETLRQLSETYSNCAIAEACCVSETTVRKWLKQHRVQGQPANKNSGGRLSSTQTKRLRKEATKEHGNSAKRSVERLSDHHVGRVISEIGEAANVVVQQANEETGKRKKFASAHDLRRGCAERLINAGVSAETLKVIFRHSSFATTEKHYGDSRNAQSVAKEVASKLTNDQKSAFVGGNEKTPHLSDEELEKLKSLLKRL